MTTEREDLTTPVVYVRPVDVSDLPQEIRVQAPPGLDRIYAVHNEDGQRLALVGNEKLAFMLAEQHKMSPVHVH